MGNALNDYSVLNCHHDRFMPTRERLLEIDVIVNPCKQSAGATFLKHSVQIPAALTEIVVTSVAERKDRKAQFTKGGFSKVFHVIKKNNPIIRRFSLSPRT